MHFFATSFRKRLRATEPVPIIINAESWLQPACCLASYFQVSDRIGCSGIMYTRAQVSTESLPFNSSNRYFVCFSHRSHAPVHFTLLSLIIFVTSSDEYKTCSSSHSNFSILLQLPLPQSQIFSLTTCSQIPSTSYSERPTFILTQNNT